MMKTVIGLTGPTGSGKTQASAFFRDKGFAILDADRMVHELYESDPDCIRSVAEAFPEAALGGKVDRKVLSDAVFSNEAALQTLNAAVFPYIIKTLQQRIAQAEDSDILLDAPTLFETGADRLCDYTLGVLAPKPLRLSRIMHRDHLTREQALARMASQPPDAFYQKRCDWLVVNDGTVQNLAKQLQAIWEALCHLRRG